MVLLAISFNIIDPNAIFSNEDEQKNITEAVTHNESYTG